MPKERPEDHRLDEAQFPRLNKTFYTSEPADYFERRLQLLAVQAGNWEAVQDILKAGVEIGALKMGAKDGPGDADPKRASQHYTATEAELLCHQAGETLLRLYFAHEFSGKYRPPCPRLDLARLRHGSDFTDRLERRFVRPRMDNIQNRRAIANVFHMTSKREVFSPGPTEEQWETSLRLHELYLRHFARQYLEGSGLYNAAKHGLALTPQEQAGFEMRGLGSRHGPAIHYLTVRTSEGQPIPRWAEIIHWVDADQQMTLTFRAITQIRMLWSVARQRYVTPTETSIGVGLLYGLSPEDVLKPSQSEAAGPMIVKDLSIGLRYWHLAEEEKAPEPFDLTAVERVNQAIAPLVPKGWRLAVPEPFEGRRRLRVENVDDPNISNGVWHEDLGKAIEMLRGSIRSIK